MADSIRDLIRTKKNDSQVPTFDGFYWIIMSLVPRFILLVLSQSASAEGSGLKSVSNHGITGVLVP